MGDRVYLSNTVKWTLSVIRGLQILMETFEQIWQSSRVNSFTWMYQAALWCGCFVLVALGYIRNPRLRRSGKLAAIAIFSLLATESSAREIFEKWRLRREWADLHPQQMTEDASHALTVDGANLTLGPLIFGFKAFLLFLGMALVLSLLRAAKAKPQSQPDAN